MDTTSHASAPREVTRQQWAWLRAEVSDWQAEGLIDSRQAAAISGRYHPTSAKGATTSVLGRLMLALGGAFVGIGLIWLVAANLDQLSPLLRFLVVFALWLGFLVGSEALDSRGASRPLVGAIRLLAALGFGALIMQAAQSLQVPAYEPALVGLWSLGAMVHAHLTRATMPFLVGLGTGLQWWFWQPMRDDATAMTILLSLAAATVLAGSLAVVTDRWSRSFAWWWRLAFGGLALATLFVAAIPGIFTDETVWSLWLVLELVAALLALAAALVAALATGVVGTRRPGHRWLEPAVALVVAAAAFGLALWDTGTDVSDVGLAQWAHGALGVVAYVALAIGLVAVDALREHRALTFLAMAGLVVFTTFQSFAVFAPIITGAWLFVVLGVVFLGTGLLFDRARRQVAQALSPTTSTSTAPQDGTTDEGAGR